MLPPSRRWEFLAAVVLVAIRLFVHRDPIDGLLLLGVCWALLALCAEERHRKVVLGGAAGLLSVLYLKGQMIHMLAAADLLK